MKQLWIGLALLLGACAVHLDSEVALVGEPSKPYCSHIAGTAPGSGGEAIGNRGPEDITIDAATGIAYISAFDRRAFIEAKGEFEAVTIPVVQRDPETLARLSLGGIYSYDLNQMMAGRGPTKMRIVGPKDSKDFGANFYPHGISLYAPPSGEKRLFVINHRWDSAALKVQSDVEVFGIDDSRPDVLRYIRTIPQADASWHLNDLVAVGEDEFYATNNPRAGNEVSRGLDMLGNALIKLGAGNIVCYTNSAYEVVTGEVPYGNGIALGPDSTTILVATSLSGELLTFTKGHDGSLTPMRHRTRRLGMMLDNIEWSDRGKSELLIEAHESVGRFALTHDWEAVHSPGVILKLEFNQDGSSGLARKLFDGDDYIGANGDRGEEFGSPSVGALFEDNLIVGSVFGREFLDCHIANRPAPS